MAKEIKKSKSKSKSEIVFHNEFNEVSMRQWTAKEMEYMRDEDHMLGTGIVNYIFETDTNSCVISYSCAQQHFYQVRYFTKDELDSYLADEKEQGAKRSLERVILDVK